MNKSAESNQQPYPLHEAVFTDDVEMFSEAIESGHDINGLNEYGETPLITAVIEHRVDWVPRILDHGADIDGTDKNGDTALDSAEYHKCKYLIDLLKERGATVRDGVSYQQKLDDDYIDSLSEIRNTFLDDRVFLYQLVGASPARKQADSPGTQPANKRWLVIIRQNCRGYPAMACHEFETEEAAVAYIKKMAPATPRVSLGEMRPDPVPTWEEFQQWLIDEGLKPMPY